MRNRRLKCSLIPQIRLHECVQCDRGGCSDQFERTFRSLAETVLVPTRYISDGIGVRDALSINVTVEIADNTSESLYLLRADCARIVQGEREGVGLSDGDSCLRGSFE